MILSARVHAQTKNTVMETKTKSISCKLTTPELQQRKATIISELKGLVKSREELSNGFRYQFHGSDAILDKLNTFIKTERMCCDFFVFQLTVEEHAIMLAITGPDGSKEFLKEEVDL
jgi:hypothetical protein